MVNYLTWFKNLDIQVYDSYSVYDSVLHPLQNITDLADGLPTKQLFAHNHATMDMQPHRGRFSIRHLKHVVLFGLPSWVGLNLLCLPLTWGVGGDILGGTWRLVHLVPCSLDLL